MKSSQTMLLSSIIVLALIVFIDDVSFVGDGLICTSIFLSASSISACIEDLKGNDDG